MKSIRPMLIMMKMFVKSYRKYRGELRRQKAWLEKFASKAGYSINRNWMFNTNLKLWLAESEDLFGKRICPCFSPTGEKERDAAMLCPCRYLKADLQDKGTCHCTLFAAEDAGREVYKKAMSRLMSEYQTPFYRNEEGEIDVRKYPIDESRGLRVPDAYHLAKRAAAAGRGDIRMFVEHPYELDSLKSWGGRNGCLVEATEKPGGYSVELKRV